MTGQPQYPEHAIQCTWCGASPGNRCTTPSGRPLSIPSHDARIEAWTATQPTAEEV